MTKTHYNVTRVHQTKREQHWKIERRRTFGMNNNEEQQSRRQRPMMANKLTSLGNQDNAMARQDRRTET
jgi:hypothetical protein